LSCSAAVMLVTQFWHAHQGGIYMAWYLPLLLLTIFRPNLEDRVALTAVNEPRVLRRSEFLARWRKQVWDRWPVKAWQRSRRAAGPPAEQNPG